MCWALARVCRIRSPSPRLTRTVRHSASATVSLSITCTNVLPTISAPSSNSIMAQPRIAPLFPYTTLFRSSSATLAIGDPDTGDTASYDISGWTSLGGGLYSKTRLEGYVYVNNSHDHLVYRLNIDNTNTNVLGVGASVSDPFTITTLDTHGASLRLGHGIVIHHLHQCPADHLGALI